MEGALPATWRLPAIPWRLVAQTVALAALSAWLIQWIGHHWDADWFAYYSAWHGGLYDQAWNSGPHAYVYSPAFAQAIWPLTLLPATVFLALWTALQLGAVIYLVGIVPATLLLYASFVPGVYSVWFNVVSGNINLFLTVAVVLGFRYRAAWAFVLLTKVTPGVGLLWFAVRREWRSLGIALGVTTAVVLVSAAFAPQLWLDWLGVLATGAQSPTLHPEIPSIMVRGPIADAIVILAAWRNWRWLVPVACMLALPQIGVSSLVMLLAIPRLHDLHDPHGRLGVGRNRQQRGGPRGSTPL